jgi:hypothetical protein
MMLLCAGGLVGIFVYLCQWLLGEAFVDFYAKWIILIPFIILIPITIYLSDRLWSRLFIQSGYLSDAATIRILSNRAPTRTSERRHRWLGQAVLLFIYGTLGFMAVMARQWWVLVIVIPLALWGVFLIRTAWKEADQMLKGGAIPPASEERIRYIENVLHQRNPREGDDGGGDTKA